MPKYYTPTQDEFSYGFSCEIRKNDDTYEKFEYLVTQDDLLKFRVKYLDTDDLIKLGFMFKEKDVDCDIFLRNVTGERPNYYLLHFYEEHGLPFIKIYNMYDHVIMDKVHIKNINELKWLLNRYGIL